MNQQAKSVRVDYVSGHSYPPVIGFDFEDFAILLVYDPLKVNGGFSTYYDQEYPKYRNMLQYEFRWFFKNITNFTFRIPHITVENIRIAFRNHEAISWKERFRLLESFTPRDILPKFFKEK